MKKENCPACKTKGKWFTPEISVCPNCQTKFRVFDIDYQKEYVEKDYWFDITDPAWKWIFIEQENQFNYIKHDLVPGKTFEVGAANGLIAQHIAKVQDLVVMQDLVDIRTDDVKAMKNIEFAGGTFEYVVTAMSDKMFNNVVMNNVIEHINDLENTFKETYRILEKDGMFIFVTDDGDNPMGSMMAMLGHNEHCFCLTKKAVEIMAEKYKFKITTYYAMTDNLIYVAMRKQ